MPVIDINETKITQDSYPSQAIEGEVPAGKTFKIEVSPNGEEIMTGTVPPGKKWRYKIAFTLVEEDV